MKNFTVLSILFIISSNLFGMNISPEDLAYKLEQKNQIRQWINRIVQMKTNNEDFNKVYGYDASNILMDAVQNADCSIVRQILNLTDDHRNPLVDINLKNKNGDTALLLAAKNGNLEKIRILLANGADIDASNVAGESILPIIIRSGTINDNYEKLTLVLKYNANLDTLNTLEGMISKKKLKIIRAKLKNIKNIIERDRRYIKYMMVMDSPNFMHYLTKQWKEVNAPVTKGKDSILCFAIMYSCKDLVINLVKNKSKLGLNLNLRNQKGATPLLIATIKNYEDITNYLVSQGANLDLQNNLGQSPLMAAACANNINIANLLVKSGANLNLQDVDGDTALIMATDCGNKEIVNKIIEGGANLNLQNDDGINALMLALFLNHSTIATRLVEKGADLNLQSNAGLNALMFCFFNDTMTTNLEKIKEWPFINKYLHLTKNVENQLIYLVDKGANLNQRDEHGNTALMYSLLLKYKKSANYLIDKGADVNLSNNFGDTALMAAAGIGDNILAQKLIDKGANLNTKNIYNFTALTIAVEKGSSSIVKKLLNKLDIVSVKNKDKSNRTALHIAIDKGHKDIVKLLLDKYKNISATEMTEKDCLNLSIWDIASKQGDLGIMELLLQYLNDANLKKKLRKEVNAKKYKANKVARKALKNYGSNFVIKDQKKQKNIESVDAINKAFIDYALKGIIPDMEILLDSNAKVSMNSIYQALRTASKTNNYKVIDSLLMKVSELNINDKDPITGNTSLIIAAENGNYEAVANLVANGALISSENNDGNTALMLAAKNGHSNVVRYLCQIGVKQRDKIAAMKYIDSEISNQKKTWINLKNKSSNKTNYEEIKEYLKDENIQNKKTIQFANINMCRDRSVYFNSHSKKDWETYQNEGMFFERVQYLIQEIKNDPYKRGATLGKVEALTGKLEGLFSRRINGEHRLVYRVIDQDIYVVSCGGHYYKLRTTKTLFKDISCFNKEWKNRELINVD